MNIKEAITLRRSVRTYKEEPLSPEMRNRLEKYIEEVDAPFDTKRRFVLLDADNPANHARLGTYGVISGAKTFICAVTEPAPKYEENLGYVFEKIILYATSLNLGTCWLGGSFKKPEFARAAGLKGKELIPIVSPVGYANEKRSLMDFVIAGSAGSKKRKDWSKLFFDKNFDKALDKEEAGPFRDVLEMVRIAPSASNKQPWRIVRDGNTFHFFLSRSTGYKGLLGFDIQRLDMGIAMCHFEAMTNELGLKGQWIDHDPGIALIKNTEYIVSFDGEIPTKVSIQ